MCVSQECVVCGSRACTRNFLFALQVVIWSCLVGDLDSGSDSNCKIDLLAYPHILVQCCIYIYSCIRKRLFNVYAI